MKMFFKNYIYLLSAFLIIISNPSFGIKLLSHKATYTLNVEDIDENSYLEGGQGQTYFEIIENCEGWNVKEDYVLIYELPNKKMSNSYSSYSTFENFSGTKHSFELNEKSELNGVNSYQGFVEKNNINISGSVINNSIKQLSFKKDTLLPLEHLKKLIEAAKNEKKIFTHKVFFGNEDKEYIKIVSAFIGKKRKSKFNDFDYFKNKVVWPMKIAFYKNNSKSENPDYEIILELDEFGVVHSYDVDYGNFKIKAVLKDFNIIKKKQCK